MSRVGAAKVVLFAMTLARCVIARSAGGKASDD